VVLYELLTGQTPFDSNELLARGIDAMRRTILEREPPRPSTRLAALKLEELTTTAQRRSSDPPKLIHLLKGDLDWVVMKCLEKDRGRRYETVNGLAIDLKRHLDNEPVTARPPSAAYRLQKIVKRNKGLVAGGSIVFAALLSAVIISGRQARIATAARERAEADAAIANAMNDFLQFSMLAELTAAPGLSSEAGSQRVLDDVARDIDRRFGGQPLTEAAIRFNLGRAYLSTGKLELAEPHLQRTLALRSKELGPEHPATLDATAAIGLLRFREHKAEEAEKIFSTLLETQRRVLGEQKPATLQTALMLGAIQLLRGGGEAMVRSYQQAAAALRMMPHPADVGLFESLLVTANSLKSAGGSAQSEKLQRECVNRALEDFGPRHPLTLQAKYDLTDTLRDFGHAPEAEKIGREVLAGYEAITPPGDPDRRHAMVGLSHTLRRLGKFSESEQLRRRVVENVRNALKPAPAEAAAVNIFLVEVLLDQGKTSEAKQALARELDFERQTVGAALPDTLGCIRDIATQWMEEGKLREANEFLGDELGLQNNEPTSPAGRSVSVLQRLAPLLLERSRITEAVPLMQEQVRVDMRDLGLKHALTVTHLRLLANLSGRLGNWAVAFESCRDLVSADTNPSEYLRGAAVCAFLLGDMQSYRSCCAELVARFGAETDPRFADSIAKTCLLGSNASTEFPLAFSLAHRAAATKPDSPLYAGSHHWFELAEGMAQCRRGEDDEAIRTLAPIRKHPQRSAATLACYFSALAQHHAGRKNDALAALEDANNFLGETLRGGELGNAVVEWFDNAAAIAIRTEAEKAILGRATSPAVTVATLASARGTTQFQPRFK
jgi:tetratricopeptide (TPR) repeat protein